MSETTSYHFLKNHTEEGEEEREGKEHEKKILIQEEDAVDQNEESAERSSLWKAVANLMSDIEGTGLLALPYVIAESGLVAIAALVMEIIQCSRGLIQCKEVTNQAEQFLELLSPILNFLAPQRCKTSLYTIVLILRGCFDRTHNFICRV